MLRGRTLDDMGSTVGLQPTSPFMVSSLGSQSTHVKRGSVGGTGDLMAIKSDTLARILGDLCKPSTWLLRYMYSFSLVSTNTGLIFHCHCVLNFEISIPVIVCIVLHDYIIDCCKLRHVRCIFDLQVLWIMLRITSYGILLTQKAVHTQENASTALLRKCSIVFVLS